MIIRLTNAIQALCQQTAERPGVSKELKTICDNAIESQEIEWNDLKMLHQQQPTLVDPVYKICQGSAIIPPKQPPKKSKPPELVAHLARLKLQLEQKQYDKYVADITEEERKAIEDSKGGLRTYKEQMSLGAHVLATMAAFYLMGHFGGRALTNDASYYPAFGIASLFLAMVVETLLVIVRNPSRT